MLPPLILELRAKAGEFRSEMAKSQAEIKKTAAEAEKSGTSYHKSGASMQSAAKVITFAAVGAGIAIAGWGVEAAMSAQKTDAQLNNALVNTGSSMKAMQGPIDATEAKMRTFGYTNIDTRGALARMTLALGSAPNALNAMGVAADLARARNMPLANAALLVTKAMEGQLGPLRRMGIDLPIAAGGAAKVITAQAGLAAATRASTLFLAAHTGAINVGNKAHAAYEAILYKVHLAHVKLSAAQAAGTLIMAALEKRVHGSAAAFGQTLAGKIAAAHATLESFAEMLGNLLIPIIMKVIGWGVQFGNMLLTHRPILIAVAAVIGGVVVAAITAYVAGMVAAAAATLAATWPIIAIVAGIALLVAAVVLAWNKFTVFRTVVTDVWKAVSTAVSVAWNGVIKPALTLLWGALQVVGGVVKWLWNSVVVPAFDGIKGAVTLAWAVIKPIFDLFWGVLGTIAHVADWLYKDIIRPAFAGIVAAVQWAWGLLKPIFDFISGGLGLIGKAAGAVGGFLGSLFSGGNGSAPAGHVPTTPIRDAGGPVVGGQSYLIGLNRKPEVFTPRGSGTISTVGGGTGGGGGGDHFHVHLDGPIIGDPSQARALVNMLLPALQAVVLQAQRRNGYNVLSGHPA
jgi:hypothetical protein